MVRAGQPILLGEPRTPPRDWLGVEQRRDVDVAPIRRVDLNGRKTTTTSSGSDKRRQIENAVQQGQYAAVRARRQ